MFLAIILRDLKLTFNNLGQFFNPIIFFFIAVSIFAFSSSNFDFASQVNFQISVIWFCLVFSLVISVSNFLRKDYEDGSLEQIYLDSLNFEYFVIIKIFSNWLIYSLPLIVFTPLAALILKIDAQIWRELVIIGALVSFIVNLVGCFCASLTVSSSRSESLLTILILPLIIPVFLFANLAFLDLDNLNYRNSILFLSLLLVFLAPIFVFFTSFSLKISLKN